MQYAVLEVIDGVLAPLAARQAHGRAREVLVGEGAHLIAHYLAVELVVEHLEHVIDGRELARLSHRVVAQQVAHAQRQLGEVRAAATTSRLAAANERTQR